MGLFNFFKKKKISTQTTTDEKQFVITGLRDENMNFINEIHKLYDEKKYDEIISAVADHYQGEQLPLEVKKILVFTYYYKKDYIKSLELAQYVALTLDDVASWFNVLSALMALNRPKQGEAIFNKIIEMQQNVKNAGKEFYPQLAVPFIRYHYAQMLYDIGLFAEALPQLEILADIYCNIKITDATFLYIRGIPFFENYIDLVKKIYEGLNLDIHKSNMVKKLISAIDSDGKSHIKKNIY